ncbi:hypothetical protein AMS68_003402 [Peltaster fructicola]|uniref:SET domain-containing protein n=1 Tax=Peltaster fructicola TaxID=286661 RepID=A0A6H0XTB9_9PEZI|nr:hypothetical protein AMS68_003402 [Peltaster fructicola]
MAPTPAGSASDVIDLTVDDEDDVLPTPTPGSSLPTARKNRESRHSREAIRAHKEVISITSNESVSSLMQRSLHHSIKSIPDRSRLSIDADQNVPRKRQKVDSERPAVTATLKVGKPIENARSTAPATTKASAFGGAALEALSRAARNTPRDDALLGIGNRDKTTLSAGQSASVKNTRSEPTPPGQGPGQPRSSTQPVIAGAQPSIAARAQTSTPCKPTSAIQKSAQVSGGTTVATTTSLLSAHTPKHKKTHSIVASPVAQSEQAQASRQLHDETTASQEAAERNVPLDSIEISDDVQQGWEVFNTQHDLEVFKTPKLPLELQIEAAIKDELHNLRDDTLYATKDTLTRARMKGRLEPPKTPASAAHVFASLKPLKCTEATLKTKTSKGLLVNIDTWTGTSKSKKSLIVPWSMHTMRQEKPLPKYSHVVRLQECMLAPNVPMLNVWPYFGDEANPDESDLRQLYTVDARGRLSKLQQLHLAQWLFSAAEAALVEADLAWSDILAFLFSRNQPARRPKGDDFPADSQRWLECSAKIGTHHKLINAAHFCDTFLRCTGLSVWQVLRRSQLIRNYFSDLEDPPSLDLADRECRVCYRFDCWVHGEIWQHPESDSYSDDGSVAADADATDIINPPQSNFRQRICFAVQDTTESDKSFRKRAKYWDSKDSGGHPYKRPDTMHTFFPCNHPGEACEGAKCSCFVSHVPCEKYCTCLSTCARKFSGCDCHKVNKKICWKDDQCACYMMGRECDADLCGGCGVEEALDLSKTGAGLTKLCQNASIQRGIPSHTLLGDSLVHELGLYACEAIPKDRFIGEYKGELLRKKEADRRGAIYDHQKLSYLFTLTKTQEVDATYCGNKIRFINHNAAELRNAYGVIMLVNTVHRIGLWAARHIDPGEELFFDYGTAFPKDQLGETIVRKAVPKARNLATLTNSGPKPKTKKKTKIRPEAEHGSPGDRMAAYYVEADGEYEGSESDSSN